MTDALKIVRREAIESGQWGADTLPLLRRLSSGWVCGVNAAFGRRHPLRVVEPAQRPD